MKVVYILCKSLYIMDNDDNVIQTYLMSNWKFAILNWKKNTKQQDIYTEWFQTRSFNQTWVAFLFSSSLLGFPIWTFSFTVFTTFNLYYAYMQDIIWFRFSKTIVLKHESANNFNKICQIFANIYVTWIYDKLYVYFTKWKVHSRGQKKFIYHVGGGSRVKNIILVWQNNFF